MMQFSHSTSFFHHLTKTLLAFFLLGSSSYLSADVSAVNLLNRMNHALRQLSYTGTLAYLRGNALSTLHIEHIVKNGVEAERVIRMDKNGKESTVGLKGFSLASIPQIRPEMLKVYSFDIGRKQRVAGIPCTIVTARPKDRERYLQKYCINQSTGMLLNYMLVNKRHKPVEQFMFTAINIKATPSGASLKVTNSNTPVKPAKKRTFQKTANNNLDLDDGWVMEALPAGYKVSQAPQAEADALSSKGKTKHYILSDGLSSLSVFISPLIDKLPAGAVYLNSGALNVVTQRKKGNVITVVGEVPEATLKNIVKRMNKK